MTEETREERVPLDKLWTLAMHAPSWSDGARDPLWRALTWAAAEYAKVFFATAPRPGVVIWPEQGGTVQRAMSLTLDGDDAVLKLTSKS